MHELLQARAAIIAVAVLATSGPAQRPRSAAPAFREAWKVVASAYPDAATNPDAVVWFETARIPAPALMRRHNDDSDWQGSGPFWLHVHRALPDTAVQEPGLLDVQAIADKDGRLRSFMVAQCELVNIGTVREMEAALTLRDATTVDIENEMVARFAKFPPSRLSEARAAFRRTLLAVSTVIGPMQIANMRFGASPNRDPSDKDISVLWVVEATREAGNVTALFEPFEGRLVSLTIDP